jgi:hypothetical protein
MTIQINTLSILNVITKPIRFTAHINLSSQLTILCFQVFGVSLSEVLLKSGSLKIYLFVLDSLGDCTIIFFTIVINS